MYAGIFEDVRREMMESFDVGNFPGVIFTGKGMSGGTVRVGVHQIPIAEKWRRKTNVTDR